MMVDYAWYPFVIYFLMIVLPLCIYVSTTLCGKSGESEFSYTIAIKNAVASYMTKYPVAIFLYHIMLSSILTLFFVGIVMRHMEIAVDLTYYTKASIKTYEAYDAIQSGKYDYSYYNYYATGGLPGGGTSSNNVHTALHQPLASQRRLGSSYDDIVLIYATNNWKNVLTEEKLIQACFAEKAMLRSLPCMGQQRSSMLDIIFDMNCEYLTSYADSLYLFGAEENEIYVEDNIIATSPESDVLLSYMSVSCSISLGEVQEAVDHSNGKIDIYYAQTDLIVDAFLDAGIHDSELSGIAVAVCLFILSLSMGFNLLFALLTILCILFALVIAAGLLPAFGFSYFSAFNILAIFVITGVGSDAILVFTSAWSKYYLLACQADTDTSNSLSCGRSCGSCGVLLPPTVLTKAYGSVVRALYFTVSTTVLSFMANLVSPIIVISQLGAYMGCAMIIYFVLLHTLMIPGWLCVTALNAKFGRNKCGVCGICFKRCGGPEEVDDDGVDDVSEMSESLLQPDENDPPPDCAGSPSSFSPPLSPLSPMSPLSRSSVASRRSSRSAREQSVRCRWRACRRGVLRLCGCTTVTVRPSLSVVDRESHYTDARRYSTDIGNFVEEDALSDSEGGAWSVTRRCGDDSCKADTLTTGKHLQENRLSTESASTRHPELSPRASRQSIVFSVLTLVSVLAGLAVTGMVMMSVVRTDWGLPLLFDEENNISKLMYVAINYKADVLSLSNDGESDIPPVVVLPPTPNPTSDESFFPSISPTHAPTYTYPTVISNAPSLPPTHAPSQRTSSPTPSPVTPSDNTGNPDTTDYTVDICYGLGIKTASIDSVATADYNAKSFGKYAPVGLLEDAEDFCDYLADKRDHLELVTPNSDCLYNQLMAVTSENISIFDRVYLWMEEDKIRYKQVGVTEAANGQNGTFGPSKHVDLTWICQPLDCQANVSSFFDSPDHALKMIDRWEKALYKKGDSVSSSMNVETLMGSDAWLFPVLSDQLVSALYVSSLISFAGCLALLLLSTFNPKLVFMVGISMAFVISVSLLLHASIFSNVINLIDIVVLISFVGIIIDYPTHMSFHYMHDIRKEIVAAKGMVSEEAHASSFRYMRQSLIGPALTTVFSAVPLLFAEFTLVSKAGEYVVIMCICAYLYVAFILPILLRMINEHEICPWVPGMYKTLKLALFGSDGSRNSISAT